VNFIQTLYFEKSINPYKHSFGWATPEYHLMSWALSCLLLKENYGKVYLYCNKEAATLLKDSLDLPYTTFYTSHNEFNAVHPKLWALPKIFTYALQNEPFLHIDGDVFIFNRLPETLFTSKLIVQNVEEATGYYIETQKELLAHFNFFPACVKKDFESGKPIKAINAGILGGNNIDFIKEYTHTAFEYINKNINHLSSINTDRFNVFFEQHLFYSLAMEKGVSIDVLIGGTVKDNQYLHLGNFHEVPCKRNYLHLLGQYKRDMHTCKLMAAKLQQLYPEYYYRVSSLFKAKPFSVSASFYTDNEELQKNKNPSEYEPNIATHENIVELVTRKTSETKALMILNTVISEITNYNSFSKHTVENDFAIFSEKLLRFVEMINGVDKEHIFERDIDAGNWFCKLFGNEAEVADKKIEKCKGPVVIDSSFDWAGLFNKYTRVGVKYYETLELEPGDFYNLVIPEINADGFSLLDIDEMEKTILEKLETPLSIKKLFGQMIDYVDEDIANNHLQEYNDLFIVMLKQLVLKKAIKPAIKID
jgi:hypothetical protein